MPRQGNTPPRIPLARGSRPITAYDYSPAPLLIRRLLSPLARAASPFSAFRLTRDRPNSHYRSGFAI